MNALWEKFASEGASSLARPGQAAGIAALNGHAQTAAEVKTRRPVGRSAGEAAAQATSGITYQATYLLHFYWTFIVDWCWERDLLSRRSYLMLLKQFSEVPENYTEHTEFYSLHSIGSNWFCPWLIFFCRHLNQFLFVSLKLLNYFSFIYLKLSKVSTKANSLENGLGPILLPKSSSLSCALCFPHAIKMLIKRDLHTLYRKMAKFDDVNDYVIHVALDNLVILDAISEAIQTCTH